MKTIVTIIWILIGLFAHSNNQVIGVVCLHIQSNIEEFRNQNFDNNHNMSNADRDTLTIVFHNSNNIYKHSLSFSFEALSKNVDFLLKDINWLSPLCMTHDTTNNSYYYHFKCLNFENGQYEVVINENTNETAWISNSNNLNFIAFDKELTHKSFFEKYSLYSNEKIKVYSKRTKTSSFTLIEPINFNCYQIISRNKDWVKIKIGRNTSCLNPNSPKGWIQLFDDGQLQYELKCR